MRKKLMMLIVGGALAVASSAWSLTLSDVGGYDKYIYGYVSANSGEATEISMVENFLQGYLHDTTYQVTWTRKIDKGDSDFQWAALTGQSNGYAMALPDRPEYFLVKFGAKPNKIDSLLFENTAESREWAAIKLADELADPEYSIKNIQAISHLREFDPAPVPEPGTMMLLGAGFLGLAVYGKRRKNA